MAKKKRTARQQCFGFGCVLFLILVAHTSALAVPVYSNALVPSAGKEDPLRQLLDAGQFLQAKEAAEAKLKTDPDNPGFLVVLGYAEAGLKQ